MPDTDNEQKTCPACGKTASEEPCCDFAREPSAAIPVTAEIVMASGDRRAIGTRWMRIGRDVDNDIVLLDDTFVSRFHAWITFEQERFWVEDLGSTNGTLLNGEPIKRRELLASGDKIKIGESEMTFALLEKTGLPG